MSIDYTYATGRRKTSTARVYLSKGKGNILVNDLPLEDYFGREVAKILVNQPFVLLEMENKFDVNIKVSGGGSFGQAGAIRHGISRALEKYDSENRPSLKTAGYLTRDSRKVERKKVGLVKARKSKQFSKR
ncbi:30S ribosomal protein S9 [SAR86 cluster bacterium]|jgi:small subunit ribosomal protein S9|nr:30S ribosomal protein S9 [SAR86 cluster bacterium]